MRCTLARKLCGAAGFNAPSRAVSNLPRRGGGLSRQIKSAANNTRGSKIRARPRANRHCGFCGPVFGPAFAKRNRRAIFLVFVFSLRTRSAKPNFYMRGVAAKRAGQPRVAGVRRISRCVLVDAPDGHKSLVKTLVDRARMDDDELIVRASAVLKSQGPENWSRGRPGPRENGSRCCFAIYKKTNRAGALLATQARSVAARIPAARVYGDLSIEKSVIHLEWVISFDP